MNRNAFTLVELAIVIVVIGLLVGGILIGRDMISVSQIRNAISQIEQFNAAANTFRNKYGGLPGDLNSAKAASFGLSYVTGCGSTWVSGCGDGNGSINPYVAALPDRIDNVSGEIVMFWKQLSESRLIPQDLNNATTATPVLNGATASTDFQGWFPPLRMRSSSFFYIYGIDGKNYYYIATLIQANGGASSINGAASTGGGLTPIEAKSIDTKIDDGYPSVGNAIAVGALGSAAPASDVGAAPATGVCVNNTTATVSYNVIPAYSEDVSCRMQVRTSF